MNSKECMEFLNRKIKLNNYYLRVNEGYLENIELLKIDSNEIFRVYVVEDYNIETLEELELEILKDIEVIENDSSRNKR